MQTTITPTIKQLNQLSKRQLNAEIEKLEMAAHDELFNGCTKRHQKIAALIAVLIDHYAATFLSLNLNDY